MIQPSKDTRDQLTPIAAKLREGRAVIRPVSQVTLRLKQVAGRDRYASSIDDILRWMNRRAGRALPDAAWQRKSFELLEIGAQRTAAVALRDPQYWAARLDDADKTVPLRTWITEIGVGLDPSGDVLFGARLVCAARGMEEPFDRSVPGFLRAILAEGPVELDGIELKSEPRLLTSEEDVTDLVKLMESPTRQADVLVFTLPDGSSNPAEAAASAKEVHDKTQGAAHVFILSSHASYFLTNAVGRELSVFRQGVRTYRPGFRAWVDQPSNHPLALPDRIKTWADEGPRAFERWVIGQTLASSVHGAEREQRLPAFNTVRQFAAQAERLQLKAQGGSDEELVRLFEHDNEQLRKELKEQKDQYDGLLIAADGEREAAVRDANAAKAQSLERLHRIRLLEARLAESSAQTETPIPDTLDSFDQWCKDHLAGSVEVANRAFQGIRKSEYHDPTLIYRALIVLRDHYVPMRVEGTSERRESYLRALETLQLEDSPTGDGPKFAPELYSVQYGGTRRSLDKHLKGGDSRDRRFGFRLYYFWDEEGQVVVVGWLPTHLDNRST